MFHHYPPLSLPTLEQMNLKTGRVYHVLNGADSGVHYPSITRVLGAKPKPQLEAWKRRVGHQEAQRVSQAASGRGKKLHALVEEYVGNHPIDTIEPHVNELWQHLSPWLDAHITGVYGQECDLYSRKLAVAGRTDMIATVDDGALAIVDFKQANRPKRPEYVGDYYLQGTFYSLALYELTGMQAKHIVIPVASPEGLQVFVTQPKLHYQELFKRIKDFYIDLEMRSD